MEPLIPMLAEPLPQSKLEALLVNDEWSAEQKLDGERMLVTVENGIAIPHNRRGEPITWPSKTLADGFGLIRSGTFAFDGEVVDRKFYCFDMPIAGDSITPASPLRKRRAVMDEVGEVVENNCEDFWLVPEARGEKNKRALLQRVMDHGGEGIMLKDLNAPYVSGKRSDKMKKVKLWKSIDVIIHRIRIEGKDNAEMVLIDPDQGVVNVGTVSTIGKKSPQPGEVFEVKFLYAVDRNRPKLVQPSLLRRRNDKAYEECTIDQLDTCFTNKSVLVS